MKTTLRAAMAMTAWMIAPSTFAADIDGTWNVSIEAPTGTSKATLVLTQAGDAIEGRYTGQFGESPVAGAVKGDEIVLTYRGEMQGVPIEVVYTGTVAAGVFSGKVTVVGFGDGKFKATRQ